jgi:hypothetical protein
LIDASQIERQTVAKVQKNMIRQMHASSFTNMESAMIGVIAATGRNLMSKALI